VLQEAVLKQPFGTIRADFRKTAYASYWAELIYNWIEENFQQVELFYLLEHVLAELDSGRIEPAVLNILFQMRFLALAGYRPKLDGCRACRNDLEDIKQDKIRVDSKRGGIICHKCQIGSASGEILGKGTIKQLLWVESGDLAKAGRIKFSQRALKEGTGFLEEFVCYHLGKQPRSLKFLRQIRNTVE
jgi:DNA repair protein RecO (recombination protein O)